jgi:RNA polymerase sigma-70 factor, ECF subfamily
MSASSQADGSDAACAVRLSRILREQHAFIWRFVRRLGVAERHVDDAVQEVFVITSGKLSLVKPEQERAFLTGTAVRVAANRRRAQQRCREVGDDGVNEIGSSEPSPEELLEQKRRRRLLDQALEALPVALRAPFVLLEIEGLTRSETATLLGLPEGTVATRVRAARTRFEAAVKHLARGPSPAVAPDRGTTPVNAVALPWAHPSYLEG